MGDAQNLVEQLGAKRTELSYVAGNLIDGMIAHADDRRAADSFLNWHLWPEELGFRSENDLTRRDAALAAWTQFADAITKDAATPFPSGDLRIPRG